MTTAQQFDLFGEMEAQEQQQADRRRRETEIPPICPSCGTHERSHWMLTNNHGYDLITDPDRNGIAGFPRFNHPVFGAHCLAQSITESHLIISIRHRDIAALEKALERAHRYHLDAETIIATHT